MSAISFWIGKRIRFWVLHSAKQPNGLNNHNCLVYILSAKTKLTQNTAMTIWEVKTMVENGSGVYLF